MEFTNKENLVIEYCLQGIKALKSNPRGYDFLRRKNETSLDKRKVSKYQTEIIKKMMK